MEDCSPELRKRFFEALVQITAFYDNSNYAEYFSNRESYKTFPLLKNYKNIIRIYPIMSPGEGNNQCIFKL